MTDVVLQNFLMMMNYGYSRCDKLGVTRLHFQKFKKNNPMSFLVWNNWMLMALLTPALSALSCLIDVYCVGRRIFRFPSDAPVISGIFCLVPLIVLGVEVGEWETITIAFNGSRAYRRGVLFPPCVLCVSGVIYQQ